MKYIIASDIHGSFYYAEKLADVFNKSGADKLILLGDILYHGPRNDLPKDYAPKKVIPLLNALRDKICCVRGNCEAEVDQMVLDFPCMSDYSFMHINNTDVFATHGHIYSPEKMPNIQKGIFACGHTHIPVLEKSGDIIVLNPGSVSIPKGGFNNSYAVFDNDKIAIYDFDGNIIKNMDI